MQRKLYTCPLLVEVQNGTAVVENNVAVPRKLKVRNLKIAIPLLVINL